MSMLYLRCDGLQKWPANIQEMSSLRLLSINFEAMQNQDLAALQHIPHVLLTVKYFSTFLLTGGTWQSLEVRGEAGFVWSSLTLMHL